MHETRLIAPRGCALTTPVTKRQGAALAMNRARLEASLGIARCAVLVVAIPLVGCFHGSSSEAPKDGGAGSDGEALAPDGTIAAIGDARSPDSSHAGDAANVGPDAGAEASRICTASTCTSVEVIFQGWIVDPDGGPEAVPIAVDDGTPDGGVNGTVVKATSADGGGPGDQNLLVGDFVTTGDAGALELPLEYVNDNNECGFPVFASRTNAYYLAPMKGLPVEPSWYAPACGCGGQCGAPCVDSGSAGACDYQSESYSQTCPNFGYNCVVTPLRIEAIQFIATTPDATCKVCLYDSTTPSTSTILKCVSPGATLSRTDLYGSGVDASASNPVLLRLDDGSNCASY